MATVNANGHEFFYERRGDGEPLLLIQGLSGNTLHWTQEFLDRLAPGHELITFDNRGVGLSAASPAGYSTADLADDTAALLDALEVDSTHVLGVSMGGMVAQELTLRHPERVRTLSLGCTSAGGPTAVPTDREVVESLTGLAMSGRFGEMMAAGYAFNVSAAYARDPSGFERMKAMAAERPGTIDVMLAQLDAVRRHDTSGRLGEISVPTLIVHGTEDRILPVGNADILAEGIRNARKEIFEGVGHLWWWERPEESAGLIRELAAGAPAPQ